MRNEEVFKEKRNYKKTKQKKLVITITKGQLKFLGYIVRKDGSENPTLIGY